MWAEALNRAGVPVVSEWRKAKNIFYPTEICEVLATLPPPVALTPSSFEQPSTILALLPPTEVPVRPDKAGDQGQEVEVAKGKGVG